MANPDLNGKIWQECPLPDYIQRIEIRNLEEKIVQVRLIGTYQNGSMYRAIHSIPYTAYSVTLPLNRGEGDPEKYLIIYGDNPNALFHSYTSENEPGTLLLYIGMIETFERLGYNVDEFKLDTDSEDDYIEYESSSESAEESDSESSEEEAEVPSYRRTIRRIKENSRREP